MTVAVPTALLRDVFSKTILGAWSPVYMQTHAQAHTRTDTQTHAWSGNSQKSLSREVVTSVALFTRLMPRCTQERVNQARGYMRSSLHTSPIIKFLDRVDHSQSPSEPERGYAMHARARRRRPAVYSIYWYTIHNSSTDDHGLGRAKTFRASMRSAAAVCRELCVAKRRRRIIIIIIMT